MMFAALNTSSSMSAENLYDLSFNSIDGSQIYLSDFKDKTIVIVNTASFCGFTRQFSGLQNIWEKYKKDGLVVIGIPSNDFNQEAKTNAEVKEFCEINFDGSATSTNNMFSVKYQLFLNDIYYYGATQLMNYAMVRSYLSDIDFLLTTQKQFRFNQRQDRIYID